MEQKLRKPLEFKDVKNMGLGDLVEEFILIPNSMYLEIINDGGEDVERRGLYEKRIEELKKEINEREKRYLTK